MKPGCSTLPGSPAWCCLPLSSNSHLIAGVQQRSSLSCTEQIKNTFSSCGGKKMLMKRRSLLFQDLSLILSCFTLQSGVGRSPGVRVGQKTVSSWAFRWVGLPLLLLSVEKVQLWCCSAWPSPTDPSSYHPSLYERKEVAHAAVVLVLQQAKMSGWKELITSWYPYWVFS